MENQYDEGFLRALSGAGIVSDAQLARAHELCEKSGEDMAEVIVRHGYASGEEVMRCLSDYLQLPLEKLAFESIDPEAVKRIPSEMACEYHVIPVSVTDDTLDLATCGPLGVQAQENISFACGCSLVLMLSYREDVYRALAHFFPGEFNIEGRLPVDDEDIEYVAGYQGGEWLEAEPDEAEVDEDHIVKLVNGLLLDAIKKRASDIHIEPKMNHSLVRYRIDGMLGKVQELTEDMHRAVVSRIKILAVLDIAERRRPQDGSIFVRFGRRDVDFRVATSPTIFGESVILRLLDQAKASTELEALGFDDEDMAKIMQALEEPFGFVLSTGPTGSGKTTTMYAMLNKMDSDTRKIITIEDPVEYRMDSIVQIPVNHEIDLGFAPLLRSVLRQDPNVILVGEIRDSETAHVAVQAAMTGHLLLSTLHTNDAPEVLLRLMEIGVEYFYVREVVKLIVAQRLVRKLCPNCREGYPPAEAELTAMDLAAGESATIYKAVGCDECGGTGYRDRIGIFEVMPMTDEIRDMLAPGVRLDDVSELARKQGMQTLWRNGVDKVLAGVTTLEEIRRTVPR